MCKSECVATLFPWDGNLFMNHDGGRKDGAISRIHLDRHVSSKLSLRDLRSFAFTGLIE